MEIGSYQGSPPMIGGTIPQQPAQSRAPVAAEDSGRVGLSKACAEMESLFIYHLLQEMRAAVPKEGLLHGGMGEEVFTSLMDGEMARTIALERGLGLARMLESQLVRQMGRAGPQSAAKPGVRVVI